MENINLQPTLMAPLSGAEVQDGSEVLTPKGVCAKMIRFSLEDNKLTQVNFTGGCDGNLKAISALVKGMEIEEIISKLSGITCGRKNTSCADQLCTALREHLK
jgi:uncharacterized protein (TIGR03905 family)